MAIRLGFRLVRSLSEDAAKHLISLRQCGAQWQDFFAFVASTGLYRDDLAALAAAGVFHCFGLSRSDALWKIEAAPFRPIIEVEEKNLHWQAESDHQKIQRDFHAFHTSLEQHPSALIKSKSWCYPVPVDKVFPANALKDLVRNRILHLFGMVLVRQAPPSAKGMVFVTLEDETGFINLAFSPDIYARYHTLVDQEPFLCIEGRLQKASDYHSILVKRVFAQTPPANLVSIRDKKPRTKAMPPALDSLVKPRSFY